MLRKDVALKRTPKQRSRKRDRKKFGENKENEGEEQNSNKLLKQSQREKRIQCIHKKDSIKKRTRQRMRIYICIYVKNIYIYLIKQLKEDVDKEYHKMGKENRKLKM